MKESACQGKTAIPSPERTKQRLRCRMRNGGDLKVACGESAKRLEFPMMAFPIPSVHGHKVARYATNFFFPSSLLR